MASDCHWHASLPGWHGLASPVSNNYAELRSSSTAIYLMKGIYTFLLISNDTMCHEQQ